MLIALYYENEEAAVETKWVTDIFQLGTRDACSENRQAVGGEEATFH